MQLHKRHIHGISFAIFLTIGIFTTGAGICRAAVSGPLSGFLYDPATSSIREVVGVPGAAYMGNAVANGFQFASVAPNGVSAFVINDHQCGVIQDLSKSAAVIPVAKADAAPALFSWALDSSAFAMSQGDGTAVLTVRSIGSSPLAEVVDLASLGGVLSSVVVSSAPNKVLAGIRDGATNGIYQLGEGTDPFLLTSLEGLTALVFGKDGKTVYGSVKGNSGIICIADVTAPSAVVTTIAIESERDQADDATSAITALALDQTESNIYLFRSAPSAVNGYSLASAGRKIFGSPLETTAANVSPCNACLAYLLNPQRDGGDPAYFLDFTNNPKVFFVPAHIESR